MVNIQQIILVWTNLTLRFLPLDEKKTENYSLLKEKIHTSLGRVSTRTATVMIRGLRGGEKVSHDATLNLEVVFFESFG